MTRLTLLLCLLFAGACTSVGDYVEHDVTRLQAAMHKGDLTSRQLVAILSRADRDGRSGRAGAQRDHRNQPGRARDCGRPSITDAAAVGAARPPARYSCAAQGEYRYRRQDGDQRRLPRAREPPCIDDAFLVARLREAGRGHTRQGNLERMGKLPLDALVERLEQHRWPDTQSLRCCATLVARPAARPWPCLPAWRCLR
jgi:hypothetical protein